jgi:hypothetical protein
VLFDENRDSKSLLWKKMDFVYGDLDMKMLETSYNLVAACWDFCNGFLQSPGLQGSLKIFSKQTSVQPLKNQLKNPNHYFNQNR